MNTTVELKTRAKRLRAAIAETLDLKIKIAQSLELVAKEENYPSWDAACACSPRQTSEALDANSTAAKVMTLLAISETRGSRISVSEALELVSKEISHNHDAVSDRASSRLSPEDQLATLMAINIALTDPNNRRGDKNRIILEKISKNALQEHSAHWARAMALEKEGESLKKCLQATGLYDSGVMLIIELDSDHGGSLGGVCGAIDFLKNRYF